MIMPMITNTTIATCSEIHVGDILKSLLGNLVRATTVPSKAHYRVCG